MNHRPCAAIFTLALALTSTSKLAVAQGDAPAAAITASPASTPQEAAVVAPTPAPVAPAPVPAPPPVTQVPAEAPTAAAPAGIQVPFEGFVVERGTRDPLPSVRVSVIPDSRDREKRSESDLAKEDNREANQDPASERPVCSAVTDDNGAFHCPPLPIGPYKVRLRGTLVRASQSRETLKTGKKTSITYYATKKSRGYETIVRAEKIRRDVNESVISVDELRRIPGTQNDAIKAVQNLPGVARAPFGAGLLVVWGSSPADTRVYADGLVIPRIFHFGGLRSTINSEFVEELTFKPGAYGADYGRGLGGIIDVKTRAPKNDRIHGSVTLDLIDGSFTIEGPLTKKLHVAASARVSWISVFLPIFNRSQYQVSPFYWDYQLSMRYRATSKDDIDVMVLGSTDNLDAKVTATNPGTNVGVDSKSYFARARMRWTHRVSKDTSFFVMPSIGADVLRADTGDAGVGGIPFKLDVLTLSYNLRAEIQNRVTPWFDIAAGVDFEGSRSGFEAVAPSFGFGSASSGEGGGSASVGAAINLIAAVKDESVVHIIRTAPYAIARFEFLNRRLVLSPQLRLDINHVRSYDGEIANTTATPEPRLLVHGQVVPKYLLLKLGIGIFSQLPQPPELTKIFGNPNLGLQYGATYVAGFEVEPTATLSVQGQFFYKDLRDMIVSDSTTRYSNGGLGRVIGGDFLVRQKLWKGLFGWVAYTISKSERKNNPSEPWRLFQFDQTHILTLVASYKLPWWGLEVGLRFRYVTGAATTPTVGAIRNLQGGGYLGIPGERYSSRLPDFHQLDLRVDKTFVFRKWKLGLYLDIQNLYNQQNSETLVYGGRQLYQVGKISGIPFFPNLGVRADY